MDTGFFLPRVPPLPPNPTQSSAYPLCVHCFLLIRRGLIEISKTSNGFSSSPSTFLHPRLSGLIRSPFHVNGILIYFGGLFCSLSLVYNGLLFLFFFFCTHLLSPPSSFFPFPSPLLVSPLPLPQSSVVKMVNNLFCFVLSFSLMASFSSFLFFSILIALSNLRV